MARAKNRGYQQSFSPSYTIRRWRLGIYIRLSKEDLKKGKDDSICVRYCLHVETSAVCPGYYCTVLLLCCPDGNFQFLH